MPSKKVRTKPLNEWQLKVPRPKDTGPQGGVISAAFCTFNKRAPYVYNVDVTKLPKELRRLSPWEYLRVAGDCNAGTVTQAVLQSASSTIRVLREQRIHATRSMAEGRNVWRKILFQMRSQLDKVKREYKWYKVPFCFVKVKYLRYCIDEINQCHRRCHKHFGFSNADLRKDGGIHYLRPKARYLLNWVLKEELFEMDVLNENIYSGIDDPGGSAEYLRRFG